VADSIAKITLGNVRRDIGLGQALNRLGVRQDKHFVLLNDTVATLLAGRAETSGRRFDSYIGFILGTGTNTSYVEHNRSIRKAKDQIGRASCRERV